MISTYSLSAARPAGGLAASALAGSPTGGILASSGLNARRDRLERLKARIPKPGEASFFFYDAHFQAEAVKVLPGEYFVFNEDVLIMTTLGSCIATCLWDRQAKIGGMNHFMLEAKAFGGGAVISGMNSINVGERNTAFVMEYLKTERIPVVSKDVLEIYPRKVCFFPHSGKAMVKRLAPTNPDAIVQQERIAAQKVAPASTGGGSIDLF